MRTFKLPAFVLFLTMIALALVSCDMDKRPTLSAANTSAATSTSSSAVSVMQGAKT
jgi:hypothetical protein